MDIAIVGGGKVGYYLARTLLEQGHHIRLIAQDRAVCQRIANELDLPVHCGDGTLIDVLDSAGISGCETFISVTGTDEVNLVACQLAKRMFGVATTVARVNNPKNVAVMEKLGVDIPISSTGNLTAIIEREVDTAAIKHIVSLNRGNASISELRLPDTFSRDGVRLMNLGLPEEAGIVSITRKGELSIPRGGAQLFKGDKLIVVTKNQALHRLKEIFELAD